MAETTTFDMAAWDPTRSSERTEVPRTFVASFDDLEELDIGAWDLGDVFPPEPSIDQPAHWERVVPGGDHGPGSEGADYGPRYGHWELGFGGRRVVEPEAMVRIDRQQPVADEHLAGGDFVRRCGLGDVEGGLRLEVCADWGCGLHHLAVRHVYVWHGCSGGWREVAAISNTPVVRRQSVKG